MSLIVFQEMLPLVQEAADFFSSETLFRDSISPADIKKAGFIAVVGGDGTFLRASHYNTNAVMLGINSNPKKKEGFFMAANPDNYKEIYSKFASGKLKPKTLLRIKASINNRPVPELALNDIYIGDDKAYKVVNYSVEIMGKTELQRGSGIIIGTPAGSTAWLKSAGGKIFDIEDRKIQYLARELYEGSLTKDYKAGHVVIDEQQKIKITMHCPGVLVVDSISSEYKLDVNDEIVIETAHDVKVIL